MIAETGSDAGTLGSYRCFPDVYAHAHPLALCGARRRAASRSAPPLHLGDSIISDVSPREQVRSRAEIKRVKEPGSEARAEGAGGVRPDDEDIALLVEHVTLT